MTELEDKIRLVEQRLDEIETIVKDLSSAIQDLLLDLKKIRGIAK